MARRSEFVIHVEYDPPPIPACRKVAWAAWLEDDEEGGEEYGSTPREAVGQILERLEDDDDDEL
jgi:hypothetical protein